MTRHNTVRDVRMHYFAVWGVLLIAARGEQEFVTSINHIAMTLGLGKATVHEMLKKMCKEGLLQMTPLKPQNLGCQFRVLASPDAILQYYAHNQGRKPIPDDK